jgi:phage protein D
VQARLTGPWQSLITGDADSVDIDPICGEMVLHGRDLTALLVSAETAETFENQTASEIVCALASRHGLSANVVATQDAVGRYFQSGRTRSAFSQHASTTSEWDMLTWLADLEGFDVWVDSNTLNFQPNTSEGPAFSIGPADCTRMRLHRRLDLAAGPTVVVRSWDSRQGETIKGIASSSTGGGGLTFTTLKPNLAFADATQLAQRTLAQISTHEVEIDLDMPGELTLAPRMQIELLLAGSGFDGTYRVMELDRHISYNRGFTQSVLAKALPWTAS